MPALMAGREESDMGTTFGEDRSATEVLVDAIVLHRVKRGIALLEEEHGPDWASKIDLNELRLCEAECCVLGQLYEDAHVSDEQAEVYTNSEVGQSKYVSDDSDGFTKGLVIIDGPLIELKDGPTRHGFVDGCGYYATLTLGNLVDATDEALTEEYGVTRAMVDEAVGENTSLPEYVGLEYGYDPLQRRWAAAIAERQS